MIIYDRMETPNKSINVKELRQRQNLSRRKVSVALDVTEMTVHRWESGVSQPHLPLAKIQTMMNLFECDFTTLCKAFEQTALETQQSADEAAVNSDEKQPIAV
jgi:transcriptional regulator with XRE-family HTH domain